MTNDPVVIVGAARTPMGGFQGDFATLMASDLGAVAIKAAVERAGIAPDAVEELIFGNCLMAGQGQAPCTPGGAQGRAAGRHELHDDLEDVRLRHEGRDARQRPPDRRQQRGDGGGRHGKHDERALPAAEGARGPAHGPRHDVRPHVPRRSRGRVRQGQADGRVRRSLRVQVRVHARGAGRVRAYVARACARREQRRHVRLGDRAGDGAGPQGRRRHQSRRAAREGDARQDREPEARVQEGRHGHGRERELDLRRCRGAGADAPIDAPSAAG